MRQAIRKAIILISLLLFPATFYYFSPYLIVDGAFQGIASGSFVMFALMLISGLFVGRAWCGWACPAAGLQEVCMSVQDKRARGGWTNWLKFIAVWLPWISIITIGFITAGGLKKIDFLHMTNHGLSATDIYGYLTFYIVTGAIVFLSFIWGRRTFCHTACWMAPFLIIGTKIQQLFRWPALHLKANQDKCTQCKTCTTHCTMSLPVNEMVLKKNMNNNECVLCGTCVDNCPNGVIRYSI